MRRYEVPIAPLLIGVILGPLAETELRRTLAVSEGDISALFVSPITIGVYLMLFAAIVIAVVQHLRGMRRERVVSGGASA